MSTDKMDLKEILSRLDIRNWAQHCGVLGIPTNPKGDWWECTCPLCGKEEHFSLNHLTGSWTCFKCGAKGNSLGLWKQLKGCENGEAVGEVKRFLGIEDKTSIPKRGKAKPASLDKPKGKQKKTESRQADQKDAAIYTRLIELAYLDDADRLVLQRKRGFSNETIDFFKLKSGGEYMTGVVSQLKEEFTDEDLLRSGILVKTNATVVINNQILEDRVLIPYLDAEGAVYHLRPHKLGFAGIASQLFSKQLVKDNPTHIVLCEGEFKAMALQQWGIPALAEPGVSSFAMANMERLIGVLTEHGVKQITVVFDTEDKSDSRYSGYKAKVEDRYDTQFWAYITAQKLGKSGFDAKVGWLPSTWQVDGKIDFDGALALGKTADEIWTALNGAIDCEEFLAVLEEEPRTIIRKKKDRLYIKNDIRREYSHYVVKRRIGDNEIDVVITNFVVNIKSSLFTPSGVIRNVQLEGKYGEKSDVFTLAPESMAGAQEFKKFCFSKGNYVFSGRGDELTKLWEFEFMRDSGTIIYMPERIGRVENDIWLFGNMAIKGGKVYRPDNDGIMWVEKRGYKPNSFQVDNRGEAMANIIPALYDDLKVDPKEFVIEIATKIKHSIQDYGAYMAVGWAIATIFSQDIFKEYKCFPLLFPQGLRESGKTTLMRWIQGFFGVEMDGIGIGESSQNFFARALSYYSSLGVWFDEYRNERKVTDKDGFFRSAYNRQSSGKGTPTAFQTRGFGVNATIAISGEDIPSDNGLLTRCVLIEMSEDRRDRKHYEWLNRNCEKFSAVTKYLIENYDAILPELIDNIDGLRSDLIKLGISDRTATNWSICAAAFDTCVMDEEGFIPWVNEQCQDVKMSSENDHALNQFWDGVNVGLASRDIGTECFIKEGNELYVWVSGLYAEWAKEFKKTNNKDAFSRGAITMYLRTQPYVLDGKATKRIDKVVRKVIKIDLHKSPQTLKEIGDWLEKVEESRINTS